MWLHLLPPIRLSTERTLRFSPCPGSRQQTALRTKVLRNRRKFQQEVWQTEELMPGPGVFYFPAVPCLPSPCCLFLCSPPDTSFLSPPGSPKLLCWSPCFPPSHHLLCNSSSLSPSLVFLILFNLYFPWKQTPSLWDATPHEQSPKQGQRSMQGHSKHACLLSPRSWPAAAAAHPLHISYTPSQWLRLQGGTGSTAKPKWALVQLPPWQICDHGPLPRLPNSQKPNGSLYPRILQTPLLAALARAASWEKPLC